MYAEMSFTSGVATYLGAWGGFILGVDFHRGHLTTRVFKPRVRFPCSRAYTLMAAVNVLSFGPKKLQFLNDMEPH